MAIATKNMFHGFYGIIRQMFWVMVFVLALGVATPNAQSTAESEYATKVLFMAVDKNDLPGVRAAIEGGANIEAVNPLGMQAVDIAVDRGYYDIAHYLISVRSQLAEKNKNNPAVISSAPQAPTDDWAARVTPPEPAPEPAPEQEQEQIAEAKPEVPIAEPEIANNAESAQASAENEIPTTTPPVPQPRPTIAEAESPNETATEAPVELSAVEPSVNSDVNTAPDAEIKAEQEPEPEPEVVEIAKADIPQPTQSAEKAPPVDVSEEAKEETAAPVAKERLTEQPEQIAEIAPQPSEEINVSEPVEPEIDALANKVTAKLPPVEETQTVEPSSVVNDAQVAETIPEKNTNQTQTTLSEKTSSDTISETVAKIDSSPSEPDGNALAEAPAPVDPSQDINVVPDIINEVAQSSEPQATNPVSEQPVETQTAFEPAKSPVQMAENITDDTVGSAGEAIGETQSATMRFFSTFLDFFKPPNTTGVVRTVRRNPEQDKINVTPSVRSAIAPREGEEAGVEANVLAEQLKSLEQQQAEFLASNPPIEQPATLEQPEGEAGQKEIELVFEDNANKDAVPDETAAKELDVIPDPFAAPTEVSKLEAKLPPHPATEEATPTKDGTKSDVVRNDLLDGLLGDEAEPSVAEDNTGLEGLLDSMDEEPQQVAAVPSGDDWALKELDSASLPDTPIPSASEIIPSGEILEGVQLALGEEVHIGQELTEKRRELMQQETIHRPCVEKRDDGVLFCIDTIFWPLDIEEHFRVDTIMYQGTRAIARYDDGAATNFHS
ncbi:MAG: hypothetical protein OEY84_08070, partial [Rhodospirillaceae bacterium]|nr:hypothetical protein [Rhodospirillaceae bacterium]